METYDFAVIGAGIAGASFAARVAPQARVLVLEKEKGPGYHATGRSAALFSELIGDQAIRALTRASRAFMETPPEGFCQHPLLSPRGALHVGQECDARAAGALCCPPQIASISSAKALEKLPVMRTEAIQHVIDEPSACDVDVNELHQGFIRLARSHQTTFINNAEVHGLQPCGNGWQIESSAGVFRAAVLVNAAGAWADQLAQLAGITPRGLQPLRRTAVLAELPAGLQAEDWPAVIAINGSYYFKPDAGWLLISPADETASEPCDAQPEDWDVAVAIERLESATHLKIRRLARRWAGLRTFAPDRRPIVGYDPQVPSFFWLAGQGGYGVQTSPALSRYAAAMALAESLPADLAAFRLDDPHLFSAHRRFDSMGNIRIQPSRLPASMEFIR